MKNNAIVLLNLVGFPEIVPVDNFSVGAIKDALSKTLRVDAEKIEKLTIGNTAIYGIKELYPSLKNKLASVNIYYAEHPAKHFHYVRVLHAVW